MTNSMAEQDKRVADLIDSIRRSFPAMRYTGDVTQYDAKLDDSDFYDIKSDSDVPDFWDEKELRDAFKGRCWTDVSPELLYRHPDGYVLLTDQAFVAFLPAWLMCSLEGMDEENEVRNFLAYAFGNTLRQFQVLNPEQRVTVRSILAEFIERGTGSFVSNLLTQTVVFIDGLGRQPFHATN
jgi:hypothetical protein